MTQAAETARETRPGATGAVSPVGRLAILSCFMIERPLLALSFG
jgi:uncharacterized membrane protein